MHLLLRAETPEPLYLGVDSTPVPGTEVLAFLAGELGLPDPVIVETGSSRGGNKRVSNQRVLGTGFTFTYPSYREGYRAVLTGTATRHP